MVLNLQLPLMFSSRRVLIRVILYNTIVPCLLVGKLCKCNSNGFQHDL